MRSSWTMTMLLSAVLAAQASPTLEKRSCSRDRTPAARSVCELFLSPGTNEARKCERLVQEIAAINCFCKNAAAVVYRPDIDHPWCLDNQSCL
ncbi:hypothetical protein BZA05DRAFT_471034, partial [Tricharina praecox]|uniref:uncharacterized protein n=1 Tax=Tricharina praecox TaxID=43433 RepID=UPI00221F9879